MLNLTLGSENHLYITKLFEGSNRKTILTNFIFPCEQISDIIIIYFINRSIDDDLKGKSFSNILCRNVFSCSNTIVK